ncbi:MAG: hypothetical protein IJ779_07045 [Ruminococcus sp.]|nr:hypothetical protein [Ruminococcus sp.]
MGNNACAEIYGYKTVGADIIRPSVSLQLAVSLVGDGVLDVPTANLKLAASLFWAVGCIFLTVISYVASVRRGFARLTALLGGRCPPRSPSAREVYTS